MSENTGQRLKNAEEIIELFGGIRPMAKKLGVAVTTVQGWKKRNAIPDARHASVLEAARAHGIELFVVAEVPEENKEEDKKTDDVPLPKFIQEQNAPVKEEPKEEAAKQEPGKEEAKKPETPEKKPEKSKNNILKWVKKKPYKTVAAQERPMTEQEALQAKIKEMERKSRMTAWVSVASVTAAAIVAALFLWPSSPVRQEEAARMEALQNNVDELQERLDNVHQEQSAMSGIDAQIQNLQAELGAVTEQIQQKATIISGDVLGENAGDINQRMTKLKEHVEDVAIEVSQAGVFQDFLSRVQSMKQSNEGRGRIDNLVGELNRVIFDIQTQARAAGKPEELSPESLDEARAQNPNVSEVFAGVPPADLKAAMLLLGMSEFRSALSRDNQPFGDDLKLLQNLLGTDENPDLQQALNRLAPHAQSGVLTLDSLNREFKKLAGDAVVASLKGENMSLQEQAQARLGVLLQIEKNGQTVTGTPAQIAVNKADKHLQAGNIEAAISEVEGLDSSAGAVLQPWLRDARSALAGQKVRTVLNQTIRKTIRGGSPLTADGVSGSSELIQDPSSGISILKQGRPVNVKRLMYPEDGADSPIENPAE